MTAPADRGPTHVGAGGDVTALAACSAASCAGTAASLLVVGVGSQMHVLDGASGDRVACATVLPRGARVHGVRVIAQAGETDVSHTSNLIFVHGDRWLAAWRLAVPGGAAATTTLTQLTRWRAHSWVHDVLPLEGGTVAAVGTADNAVTVVRVGAETDVATFSPWPRHPTARCDARGVLYSMALTLRRDGAVWAAAGTAFLDVVLWRVGEVAVRENQTAPAPTAPAAVLAGHTGSIHRVAWAPGGDLVASASDDRSVRVWRVDEKGEGAQIAIFAGHGARLWDVAFLTADLEPVDDTAPPAFVASACEDGAARVWPLTPPAATPAATLRGHTGRGVWRLAATHGGTLVTAGADGTALAWRVADFLEGAATRGRAHDHIPWPAATPRPAVSCLAPFAGTTLLVGAGDGAAWRIDLSAGACPPWHAVLPPDPARGSILSLDAAPCWRCASPCVMVLAGCGRGHAALACGSGAVAWPAAPPAPATTDDRLPPLQRVCLPAAWGGRVAVTASTLGDVRLWRVGSDAAAPPALLAAAPPRRARRRDATVAAITATEDLLFVADTAGGVAVFRVPPRDVAPATLLTPLARATTPGATAATCIALGRGVAPPGEPGGGLRVRVGDAAGRVSHWALSLSPPALARCGGDRAPFPVVTFDGAIGADRVLAGFRGDDWCAALPEHGGGSEVAREPGTGGWRRPAALLPGATGTPPTLIWSPPSRAGDAPGLAVRRLGGGGGGGPPPRMALPAGHGLEVWAGVLLPGPDGDDAFTPAALATAGEDGAVIVTRVAPREAPGGLLPPSARAGGLLDGASLRALTAVPDPDHPACWLLFAAGAGGGGVTAWRGWWSRDGGHETNSHHHFCTAWAASSVAAPRTNARVAAAVPRAMGVAAVAGEGGVAVFVALSTGTIMHHPFAGSTFHPPTRLPHPHAGAALCIGVAGATCATAVVASGGTDGRLIVRRAKDAAKQTAAVDRLHQSGILALSMAETHTGVTVVTAGDDQAIGVVWLDVEGGCIASATVAAAHASAVRGVWTDGATIVSVALDRTLAGWRLPDEPGGDVAGPLWVRSVQVPAPVGVTGLATGGRALVAVVGRGCQVWAN